MKPVDPKKLLELIEEKLGEQSQSEKMTQGKIPEWIKTRARKMETENQKQFT